MATNVTKELDALLHQFDKFIADNKAIYDNIKYLTISVLHEKLKFAKSIKCGYFKNDDGSYLYIKGIEVYGDVGDLCRMGYNGEDRGVFAHYVTIDANGMTIHNEDVGRLQYYMSSAVADNLRYYKCDKAEFDAMVASMVHSIHTVPDACTDIDNYIQFVDKYTELSKQIKQAMLDD